MPANVTISGKAGAGTNVAATVFNNVDAFHIDTNKNLITLFRAHETVSPISISAATVVTATKSGVQWTLVIN